VLVAERKPATTGMPETEGTPAEVGIDKADNEVAGTLAIATIPEAAENYKHLEYLEEFLEGIKKNLGSRSSLHHCLFKEIVDSNISLALKGMKL